MNTFLKSSVVITLLAASRAFGGSAELVTNTTLIDLASSQASISINVPYPGPTISGLCGIEIRTDSYNDKPIKEFLEAIEVSDAAVEVPLPVVVKNAKTIFIDLSATEGGYAAYFSIKTKDGTSLASTIRKVLGDSRRVVLVGASCP